MENLNNQLARKAETYLDILCREIEERCVGSEGNMQATTYFESVLASLDWATEVSEFGAIDWEDGGAILMAENISFEVQASPYSKSCNVKALLVSASSIPELEAIDASDKILMLQGDLAKEQLMPKNFVFYNPERHQKIVSLLEASGARAIICATGRNADLAGGVYPFPLIEDGDFDIPSVFMTEEEGARLIPFTGKQLSLESNSERIPSKGFNVKGTKGSNISRRIVVTAHIDAKKGTPGAIDNATGVIVLLLLAELLKDYDGGIQIELVALNGEDYYAVPGQMLYIKENQGNFETMLLNINIDGAGFKDGKSSFSFFNLPDEMKLKADEILERFPGIVEGPQWPQGDHSIFIQYGIPAIAVSSKWFVDNIGSQEITHTPKDKPGIVDVDKLLELAESINLFIRLL
jgi:aminopeptidase YwaD